MSETAAAVEAPPSSIVTITSETAQAFYDEKLGVAADTQVGGNDTPGDTIEADPEDEVKKEAKGNPKIQARFSDLTKARKEAEERAKSLAEEARQAKADREAIQAERDALKAKYEPPKTEGPGPEPQPEQFENASEYGKALKAWTTETVEFDRSQKEATEKTQREQAAIAKAWKERQDAFRKDTEDYDDKISTSTAQVSDVVRDAILESDVGPQVLYHLATNPDDADKIGKMTPPAALRFLGRLEAKLAEPKETPKTTLADVSPKVEVSKAPKPATPIRGASAADTPRVDSNGKYHGTYAQFVADRQAGRI